MSLESLTTDLRLMHETVGSAFDALVELEESDVQVLAELRVLADEVNRSWFLVREALDNRLGDAMGGFETVVEGVGQIKRHKKKSRTRWQTEDLVLAVKDSLRVTEDGEIVPETELEKVLAVWNLGAPRTTVLKARGIDAEQFCEVEVKGGWQVEIR